MASVYKEDLIEVTTCNQGLIKDNWKIIGVFKHNKHNDRYYAEIECTKCGFRKYVRYHQFLNSKHPKKCSKCGESTYINNLVGKTLGIYKVLAVDSKKFVRYAHSGGRFIYYLKVKCQKCGCEYILCYTKSLEKAKQCLHCNSVFGSDSGKNALWNDYKGSAHDRNLDWELTPNQFSKLISENCHYCNTPPQPKNIRSNKHPYMVTVNGIDRLDASKGYTIDNVVSCCTKCNYMKLKMTEKEFIAQVTKIYNFINQGSTTIPNGSTLQAYGNGSGEPLSGNAEGEEIV